MYGHEHMYCIIIIEVEKNQSTMQGMIFFLQYYIDLKKWVVCYSRHMK